MITAMSLTNGTLTVILDSGAEILTARNDHPKWAEISAAFKLQNETELRRLLSMKAVMEHFSNGDLSVDGTGVLYRNKPLHGVDSDRVMSFLKEGLPYQPIANYMAKKMKNPSARAIQEMYGFLEHKNMALTPNGNFIAYKGVDENYYSIRGNVDTPVIQGTVNDEGKIFNRVGDTIEVERNSVDDNFQNHCSTGLHAGSLQYAIGWGKRVILVEIDPMDVVSIPSDSDCQKLRCCKYKVVGDYAGALPDTYSAEFSSDKPNPEVTIDDDESEIDYDELDMEDDDEDDGNTCSCHGPDNSPTDNEKLQECEKTKELLEIASELKKAGNSQLSKSKNTKEHCDTLNTVIDNFFNNMCAYSFADGVEDRKANNPPEFEVGDDIGADSNEHAIRILSYIKGYSCSDK